MSQDSIFIVEGLVSVYTLGTIKAHAVMQLYIFFLLSNLIMDISKNDESLQLERNGHLFHNISSRVKLIEYFHSKYKFGFRNVILYAMRNSLMSYTLCSFIQYIRVQKRIL